MTEEGRRLLAAATEGDRRLDSVGDLMPWKRWSVFLSGDWENGWTITAMSRVAGGGTGDLDISLPSERRWGATLIGYPTASEAVDALIAHLRPPSRDSTPDPLE